MELDFREWVELQEAIKIGDIVSQAKQKIRDVLPRSWEELFFHLVSAKPMPPAVRNRVRGLFNGVYAGKKGYNITDNPYKPEDVDFYQGWVDGFNSARTGSGLLPDWFVKLFGIRDLFKAFPGTEEVA
jgi:hypothetical protein